ncbi:cytochrome d ubiquinol oxidase subunit II [Nonomuraea typhae]|uniref:cytochrome d ubiquinol oxidase subunit II n=1 Tax=Nonomuraea typhae TaxID=2603600 RepID=UPI0012FB8D0F|nr:cytochrome d ubiquinol oxidase subunit II [Nonomuraea typhae]
MELLWPILLGLLFAGYFVVDGFDIGAGMLLRRLGGTEYERRVTLTSIGPFFLGNEVWLVAVGGVLAGAFPVMKDHLLGGLYLLIVAGLLIWVVRDAAIWFRSRRPSPRWRRGWDTMLTSSSWVFAVFWGLLVGTLLTGPPPLTGRWLVAGLDAALWAVVMVLLFATHGAAFLSVRYPASLAAGPAGLAVRLARPAAVLLGFASLVQLVVPGSGFGTRVLMAALGVLAAAGLLAVPAVLSRSWYGAAVALTAFATASPAVTVGVRLAGSMSGVAADVATLRVLGGFLLVVVPVLAIMQTWMWWTFRRRVDAGTVVFF